MTTPPDKTSPPADGAVSSEASAGPSDPGAKKPWLKYLGVGAFWFFLIKGLLWLIVPAALLWFGYGGGDTE